MAQVRLDDVVKTYGSVHAVDHLSLTINDGEFVALVGPSGCGKTTTLNLVAGLIELTSGDIFIGDRLVNDLDPKDRDIAMVFQNYALYPNKTIFQNLAFPLKMRKLSRAETDKKVREAARVLDITHLLERRPRELSGGQQQRVALGRALVRDPLAFLMDEPLSNLDALLRVQMRSELKRFHQDLNATVIYVTHDQLEAVTMADKMAVMRGGVLQQYDSPERVFANPVNTFVAGFVGSPAMSLVSAKVLTVAGGAALEGAGGWRCELSPPNARKALSASADSVIMGARHSTILLHATDKPGAISSRVYTVEPTGDITYVHVFLGESIIVISVPPDVQLQADETVWVDGPLTQAVRRGAICYLDEVVEARKDTTVLIHPLSDHRRILPIEKRGETIEAHDGFLLVISYNPGYQSIQKNLKHSTRQRFVTIEFTYPPADKEVAIIAHEAGVENDIAMQLAVLGEKVRHLKASGLEEGVSTRLLIYAGELIRQGISPRRAATVAVTWSLTDEADSKRAIDEVVKAIFP